VWRGLLGGKIEWSLFYLNSRKDLIGAKNRVVRHVFVKGGNGCRGVL